GPDASPEGGRWYTGRQTSYALPGRRQWPRSADAATVPLQQSRQLARHTPARPGSSLLVTGFVARSLSDAEFCHTRHRRDYSERAVPASTPVETACVLAGAA